MKKMTSLKERALDIANNAPLTDAGSCHVFFSNQRNRTAAVGFCEKNPGFVTVMHTEALKRLVNLDLFGRDSQFSIEEAVDISAIVSARFAQSASGNVLVFSDKISDRSTFFSVELPVLMANDRVTSINGAPKETWAHFIMPSILPRSTIVTRDMLQPSP